MSSISDRVYLLYNSSVPLVRYLFNGCTSDPLEYVDNTCDLDLLWNDDIDLLS